MTLDAGVLLSDNLRLVRVLGRGAMGTVWVAENISLGSKVAVKVLHHGAESEEARARFAQEARGVAAIDSPHVVTIFDYGVTPDGEPYIVMELLRGEDLREFIEREGPLSPQLTAQLVRQMARALSRAHAAGIVHRDIKPANIFLVDNDGEPLVKVLDFGVAKRLGADDLRMTETGAMMGTPYYMSPEQLLDPRSVDARTDLWAVGAVAYACMTASLPFVGETLGALSVAIHSGDFEAPSARCPGLPPALDSWMAKALARAPEQRFATAREMADALAEAAGLAAPASADLRVSMPAATPAAEPPAAEPPAAEPPAAEPPVGGNETEHDGGQAAAAEPAPGVLRQPPGARDGEAAAELAEAAVSANLDDTAVPSSTLSDTAPDEAPASAGLAGGLRSGADSMAASSRPATQPMGLGRMGMVALVAAGLAGGGVLAGVKLSGPTANPSGTTPTGAATQAPTADPPSATASGDGPDGAPSPEGTATASVASPAGSSSAPHAATAAAGKHALASPGGAGGTVSASTVRAAVLSCWRSHEGASPDAVAVGVSVLLDRHPAWGAKGLAEVHPRSLAAAPRFHRCAVGAAKALLPRYDPPGGGTLRVPVSLPGKQVGPAFPSEAEVRAGVLACWMAHEGSQPGTAASVAKLRFQARGGASGPHPPQVSRAVSRCVMAKVHDWRNRGHDINKRIDMTVALPAGPPAADGSSPSAGGGGG